MKKEDFNNVFNSIYMENAKAFKQMVEEERKKSDIKGLSATIVIIDEDFANFIDGQIEELEKSEKRLKENLQEEKLEEFKAGDRVKNINKESIYFGMVGTVTEIHSHACEVKYGNIKMVCLKDSLEKIEDKQEGKPFELKKGMKFKIKNSHCIHDFVCIDDYGKICDIAHNSYTENKIDWEETRKLNKVKEEPIIEIDIIKHIETLKAQGLSKKRIEDKIKFVYGDKKDIHEILKESFQNDYKIEVKEVVCDYGVYENGKLLDGLIMNNRSNAELIAEILRLDHEHKKYEVESKEKLEVEEFIEALKKTGWNEAEIAKKVHIFTGKSEKEYMILKISGDSPTKKYSTYEEALEEAKKLAENTLNAEFNIVEAVSKVKGIFTVEVVE